MQFDQTHARLESSTCVMQQINLAQCLSKANMGYHKKKSTNAFSSFSGVVTEFMVLE
jgi:hypothetical protein